MLIRIGMSRPAFSMYSGIVAGARGWHPRSISAIWSKHSRAVQRAIKIYAGITSSFERIWSETFHLDRPWCCRNLSKAFRDECGLGIRVSRPTKAAILNQGLIFRLCRRDPRSDALAASTLLKPLVPETRWLETATAPKCSASDFLCCRHWPCRRHRSNLLHTVCEVTKIGARGSKYAEHVVTSTPLAAKRRTLAGRGWARSGK